MESLAESSSVTSTTCATITNATGASDAHAAEINYLALVLIIFPIVTLFGNVLVVVSVLDDRTLRTVTNYFIVSLAVADIMVAVLVMPLGIYVELNGMQWELGDRLCDTWVACDVMCCTASILNLVAISIDRFIAVTKPIKYAKHKNATRVYVMMTVSWAVSAGISLPIPFVNYTPQRHLTPTRCAFYNSDFLIYSSMGSFYIPCVVMLYLYGRIFRAIRQRAKSMSRKKQWSPAAEGTTVPTDDVMDVEVEPSVACTAEDVDGDAATQQRHRHLVAKKLLNAGRDRGVGKALFVANVAAAAAVPAGYPLLPVSTSSDNREHLFDIPCSPYRATLTLSASDTQDEDESDNVRVISNVAIGTDLEFNEILRLQHSPPDVSTSKNGKAAVGNGKPRPLNNLTLGGDGDKDAATVGLVSRQHQLVQQHQQQQSIDFIDDEDVPPSPASFTSAEMTTISKLVVVLAPSAHVQRAKQTMAAGINMLLRRRRRKQRVSNRREKKATKTLAIVLGVFLVCWAPFFTVNIIDAICIRYQLGEGGSECHIPSLVFSSSVWLGYINSALNPIIYTIFNLDFRRAFKRVLFRLITVHH